MVCDRVLNNLQQLLVGVGGADGKSMQELDHESGKTLECSRNANRGIDFDQNAFCGMDVNLKFTGFINGGVE